MSTIQRPSSQLKKIRRFYIGTTPNCWANWAGRTCKLKLKQNCSKTLARRRSNHFVSVSFHTCDRLYVQPQLYDAKVSVYKYIYIYIYWHEDWSVFFLELPYTEPSLSKFMMSCCQLTQLEVIRVESSACRISPRRWDHPPWWCWSYTHNALVRHRLLPDLYSTDVQRRATHAIQSGLLVRPSTRHLLPLPS